MAHTLQDFCRGALWCCRLSHYVFVLSQENRATPRKIALSQLYLELFKRGISDRGSYGQIADALEVASKTLKLSQYKGRFASTLSHVSLQWVTQGCTCSEHGIDQVMRHKQVRSLCL